MEKQCVPDKDLPEWAKPKPNNAPPSLVSFFNFIYLFIYFKSGCKNIAFPEKIGGDSLLSNRFYAMISLEILLTCQFFALAPLENHVFPSNFGIPF